MHDEMYEKTQWSNTKLVRNVLDQMFILVIQTAPKVNLKTSFKPLIYRLKCVKQISELMLDHFISKN